MTQLRGTIFFYSPVRFLTETVCYILKIHVANEPKKDHPFCLIKPEDFALLSCSLEKDCLGLQLYFPITKIIRFEHVIAERLKKIIFLSLLGRIFYHFPRSP